MRQPAAPSAAATPAASVAGAPADSVWTRGWEAAWRDVWHGLRDLVRVSRIDQPEAALLAPEQGYFLRENLKLQLLNARLALLARQQASAQADLKAVEDLLARYFDAQSPGVKGAITTIAQLREAIEDPDATPETSIMLAPTLLRSQVLAQLYAEVRRAQRRDR